MGRRDRWEGWRREGWWMEGECGKESSGRQEECTLPWGSLWRCVTMATMGEWRCWWGGSDAGGCEFDPLVVWGPEELLQCWRGPRSAPTFPQPLTNRPNAADTHTPSCSLYHSLHRPSLHSVSWFLHMFLSDLSGGFFFFPVRWRWESRFLWDAGVSWFVIKNAVIRSNIRTFSNAHQINCRTL